MQLLNILFSLAGVVVKLTSVSVQKNGMFSIETCIRMSGYVAILLVYAYCWQKIIKAATLSWAYLVSSMSIFWSMIWAITIFGETLTIWNLVGVCLVFVGTLLVNSNE